MSTSSTVAPEAPADTTPSDRTPTQPRSLAPAKEPVGLGPVPVVGIVLSVVLLALGVVAVRDALLAAGALEGTPWVAGAIDAVDGWTPQVWIAVVGGVLVLLGLWLVVAALRPRPRTSLALRAETGVYLGRRDVDRVAANAASEVDGVLEAHATSSRRKIDVKVSVTGGSSTIERVTAAVEHALEPLEHAPKVRIRSTDGGRA